MRTSSIQMELPLVLDMDTVSVADGVDTMDSHKAHSPDWATLLKEEALPALPAAIKFVAVTKLLELTCTCISPVAQKRTCKLLPLVLKTLELNCPVSSAEY